MAVWVSFPQPAHRRIQNTLLEKTKDHKPMALWSDFDQWLSLALPRALLRAKTFLPFAVAILLRKPCTFSDESSSADMFSSKQYLLSRSDGRTASHRFLGSPPRPDEPVCVNPFTIYYSGFRFICQALRQTFLRNFRLFFFFHRFSTAVLGRLHGFFVGF